MRSHINSLSYSLHPSALVCGKSDIFENISNTMKSIENKDDVALLVNTFYTKVLANEKLAPFFKTLDFDHHMPKMIHFWSFVLLDEEGYTTNVTEKHSKMRLTPALFDTWVALFSETVDSLFHGEKAEMAKQRAALLGWTMKSKL